MDEIAKIATDVLAPDALAMAKKAARALRFNPVAKENGERLWVAPVPQFVNRRLHSVMEFHCGVELEEITSFFRLNTRRHDTEFRVHCDHIIQGQTPTHASVFYLETAEDSGTALFRHPVHGDRDDERLSIFDEDDGQWEAYLRCPEVENTMFIYRAELFHGRFPWQARGFDRKDGRIVIVKFMKETGCLNGFKESSSPSP